MTHPLVTQLHFTRGEFLRCLEGISAEDAVRILEPHNTLSWMIGHLASQENAFWVMIAQGRSLYPELYKQVGSGFPPSSPPLDKMLAVWREVTQAADEFLEPLQEADLTRHLEWKGSPRPESIGTMLLRNIYHYWFHTGEAHPLRASLGHTELPEFVGKMSSAIYRRE